MYAQLVSVQSQRHYYIAIALAHTHAYTAICPQQPNNCLLQQSAKFKARTAAGDRPPDYGKSPRHVLFVTHALLKQTLTPSALHLRRHRHRTRYSASLQPTCGVCSAYTYPFSHYDGPTVRHPQHLPPPQHATESASYSYALTHTLPLLKAAEHTRRTQPHSTLTEATLPGYTSSQS